MLTANQSPESLWESLLPFLDVSHPLPLCWLNMPFLFRKLRYWLTNADQCWPIATFLFQPKSLPFSDLCVVYYWQAFGRAYGTGRSQARSPYLRPWPKLVGGCAPKPPLLPTTLSHTLKMFFISYITICFFALYNFIYLSIITYIISS